MAIPALPPQGSTSWYPYAQALDGAARGAAVIADVGTAGTPTGDAITAVTGSGYLLACFRGDTAERMTLNAYFSGDGASFADHGRNPVWSPTDGSVVRDPSVIYTGGYFYAAYTRTAASGTSYDIARSSDLFTWTKQATVDVSSIGGATSTWAPELAVDTDGSVYCFVSINATTIYRQKATVADLSAWSAPTPITLTGGPAQTIDPTFVQANGGWMMFYKNEVTGQKVIERATASTLTGSWTVDRTGNWAGWGANVEGPSIVQKRDGTFRIYVDRYGAGTGLGYSDSADLNTWTPLASVTTRPALTPALGVLRHGSVIRLSDPKASATAAALGMAYPSRSVDPSVPALQNAAPGAYMGVDGVGNGVIALVDASGTNWRIDLTTQNGKAVLRIVKANTYVAATIPLDTGNDLTWFGGLNFTPTTATTAPGAGGAGALPATPAGYMAVTVNGTVRQVPYY